MKSIISFALMSAVLFAAVITLSACKKQDKKEGGLPEGSFTKDATLYYYLDPGFIRSTCHYVIETDDDEIYAPIDVFKDGPFTGLFTKDDGDVIRVRVTYRVIGERLEDCIHRGSLSRDFPEEIRRIAGPLPLSRIEVTAIERKENKNPVMTEEVEVYLFLNSENHPSCRPLVKTKTGGVYLLGTSASTVYHTPDLSEKEFLRAMITYRLFDSDPWTERLLNLCRDQSRGMSPTAVIEVLSMEEIWN